MDKKLLGLLGIGVVFCGVFAPALNVPALGTMSYMLCGGGDGTLLMALALLSILFVQKNMYRALLFAGLASLGIVIYTYAEIYSRLSALDAATAKTYHLSWGWAVLITGITVVLISAVRGEKDIRAVNSQAVPET